MPSPSLSSLKMLREPQKEIFMEISFGRDWRSAFKHPSLGDLLTFPLYSHIRRQRPRGRPVRLWPPIPL